MCVCVCVYAPQEVKLASSSGERDVNRETSDSIREILEIWGEAERLSDGERMIKTFWV